MKEIIDSWKGWRIEFEQWYGSDCDGACEYSGYSTFDWSIDLAEIIESNMMGWLTGKHSGREYSRTYLLEATVDELKINFTCGYGISLSKNNPSYGYSYSFGRGDYRDVISLIPPGAKEDKISQYETVCCRHKCLLNLRPKDIEVPETIEPVDLGLSVDWAPFNVGALKPEDLGDRFAWSETEPDKEGYSYIRGLQDENGKTMFENGNYKYEFSGLKKYDAAALYWGDGWRTPGKDEISELIYNCEWTWTVQNGREGYNVTGRTGNSIFIPLDINSKDVFGRSGKSYWSSNAYMMPGGSTKGYTLHIRNFIHGDYHNRSIDDYDTAAPMTIRPVRDKK